MIGVNNPLFLGASIQPPEGFTGSTAVTSRLKTLCRDRDKVLIAFSAVDH
jgi:hypothetical protein